MQQYERSSYKLVVLLFQSPTGKRSGCNRPHIQDVEDHGDRAGFNPLRGRGRVATRPGHRYHRLSPGPFQSPTGKRSGCNTRRVITSTKPLGTVSIPYGEEVGLQLSAMRHSELGMKAVSIPYGEEVGLQPTSARPDPSSPRGMSFNPLRGRGRVATTAMQPIATTALEPVSIPYGEEVGLQPVHPERPAPDQRHRFNPLRGRGRVATKSTSLGVPNVQVEYVSIPYGEEVGLQLKASPEYEAGQRITVSIPYGEEVGLQPH